MHLFFLLFSLFLSGQGIWLKIFYVAIFEQAHTLLGLLGGLLLLLGGLLLALGLLVALLTLLLGGLDGLLGDDGPRVDLLCVVVGNDLDLALLQEILERQAGEGSVDLKAVNQDRGGNELVCGDLLKNLAEGLLVEGHSVVGLILNLSLGPLLLLLLSTAGGGGSLFLGLY